MVEQDLSEKQVLLEKWRKRFLKNACKLKEEHKLRIFNAALERNLHKKAYRKIIKKKIVKIRCIRFINLGVPRSGKTTFWRRIMKDMLNLSQARQMGEMEEQPSTGLADHVLMNVSAFWGTVSSDEWYALGDDEEASTVLQFFSELCQKSSSASSESEHSSSSSSSGDSSPPIAASEPPNKNPVPKKALLSKSTPHYKPHTGGDDSPKTPKELDEIFSLLFSKAMQAGKWATLKCALEQIILLSSIDTGGHAEFLDMHASLINGPSFNLLFSKLNDNLGGLFKVSFTNEKGESTKKEDSDSTVEEVLFQALSSIACLGNSHLAGESMFADDSSSMSASVEKLLKSLQSKVLFVGTR